MLGGSLFDGIAGFPLAGQKVGITFVWASEIEPFPISVSKRHFPNMKHLGDITKINGAKIKPVDVITFGSPCQDLSAAGKRAGIGYKCHDCEHEWSYSTTYGIDSYCPNCESENIELTRSGLFMEAIRIIREMRDVTNGLYPRFIVWENVPGAFSSNGGYDFKAVLSEISEMVRGDGIEIAWRVLDAQYWGIPQRRKRIFLVADFRGGSSGEILFKPESMRGDTAEGEGEREGTAGCVAVGVGESSDVAHCLRAGASKADKHESTTYVVHPQITGTQCASGAGMSRPAGMASEIDLVVAIGLTSHGGYSDNSLGTLRASGGDCGGGSEMLVAAIDCRNLYENLELSATLQSKGGGGFSLNYINPIRQGYRVRRLTPTECERLQGLPDGYTAGGSDTARYKALGNGMAQPCPDYIIAGIAEVLRRESTT